MSEQCRTYCLSPGLHGRQAGLPSEDLDSNFDGYVNEDKDVGLQDHGGHVQQE